MHEKKKLNFFIKLALLAFVLFCVVTVTAQEISRQSLTTELESLNNRKKEISQEVAEMEDQLQRPFDEEYIKKIAREKLGYYMPKEIIYYNDLTK